MIVYEGHFEVPDIIIDHEKCTLCQRCVLTCPMQVLKVIEKKVVQIEGICFACRNCEAVCVDDAINVKGTYRVLKGKRQIGYIRFPGFPEFKGLAPDKMKIFEGK